MKMSVMQFGQQRLVLELILMGVHMQQATGQQH